MLFLNVLRSESVFHGHDLFSQKGKKRSKVFLFSHWRYKIVYGITDVRMINIGTASMFELVEKVVPESLVWLRKIIGGACENRMVFFLKF